MSKENELSEYHANDLTLMESTTRNAVQKESVCTYITKVI